MILLTGSNGFVGSSLKEYFKENKISYIELERNSNVDIRNGININSFFNVEKIENYLPKINTIIHIAGKSHTSHKKKYFGVNKENQEYRVSNSINSYYLMRFSIENNIRNFIFMSTIKVYGEFTEEGFPITLRTPENPYDSYGFSKFEAEKFLLNQAKANNIDLNIIRSPLILGEKTKGSLFFLKKFGRLNLPMIYPRVKNKRSATDLKSIIEKVGMIIEKKNEVKKIFFPKFKNYSTQEIMGKTISRKIKMIGVHPIFFSVVLWLLGMSHVKIKILKNQEITI